MLNKRGALFRLFISASLHENTYTAYCNLDHAILSSSLLPRALLPLLLYAYLTAWPSSQPLFEDNVDHITLRFLGGSGIGTPLR